MKFKMIQFVIVVGILTCFFLPMFNVEETTLTGFEAIFSNDILLFGNIVLAVVLVMTALHLMLMAFEVFKSKRSDSLEEGTNMVVNIGLIAGLLMVTFLGWYTNIISIVCVLLMIGSAYVRYKYLG